MSDQQPFTPFPFVPSQPGPPTLLDNPAMPSPANDAAPPAKKKRGPKPGSKRVSKPARKGRRVGKHPELAGAAALQAPEFVPSKTEINVSVFMEKLANLTDPTEIKAFISVAKTLQSLPFNSRERILDDLNEIFI